MRHRVVDPPFRRIPVANRVFGCGRNFCLIRVRPDAPFASGWTTRAYLSTSQNRFWQSISWSRRPQSVRNSSPSRSNSVSCRSAMTPDHVGVGHAARVRKALPDSVDRPRAGNDELHLGEVGHVAVVDVGDVLVRQEVADGRVVADQVERLLHRPWLRPAGRADRP